MPLAPQSQRMHCEYSSKIPLIGQMLHFKYSSKKLYSLQGSKDYVVSGECNSLLGCQQRQQPN
jgi:hypothetical protein